MHVEHENHLREMCFRPLSNQPPPPLSDTSETSVHARFRGFDLLRPHHNDDDAENKGDG
jgi:hypothetical protein